MIHTDDGMKFQSFAMQDVLGRNIICECGEPHKVEQISYSHRWGDLMVLNEHDEDMVAKQAERELAALDTKIEDPFYELKTSPSRHYWVHVLSLSCQMYGRPMPTPEQKAAFTRWARALRWEPTEKTSKGGSGLITPSGLILSR